MNCIKKFIRDLANEVKKKKIKGTEFLVKKEQNSLEMTLIGSKISSWPSATILLYALDYGAPALGEISWRAELWKKEIDELPNILLDKCRRVVLQKYPFSESTKVINVKKDLRSLNIKKIAEDLYGAYTWWKNMKDLYRKKKIQNKIEELLDKELLKELI